MHFLKKKMPSAIGKIKNWLFNKKGKSIKENAQSFPEVFGTPTKMQRSIEQDGTESLGLNFQIKSGSPRRKISQHSSFAPRELILPPIVDVDDFEMDREDGFLNRALRAIRSEPVLVDDYFLEKAFTAMQKNTSRQTLVMEMVIELRQRLHCPKCKAEVKRKAGKIGIATKLWCHNKSCEAAISHLEMLHQMPAGVMKALLLKLGQRQFLELLRKVPGVKMEKLEELECLIPGSQKKQSGLDQFFVGQQAEVSLEAQAKVSLFDIAAAKPLPEEPEFSAPLNAAENSRLETPPTPSPKRTLARTSRSREPRPSPDRILQRPQPANPSPGKIAKKALDSSSNPFSPLQKLNADIEANLILARPEFSGLSINEVILTLWRRTQEASNVSPEANSEKEVTISEPRQKIKEKVASFHAAALNGGQALKARTEKYSTRNKPITIKEALKVIDLPAKYRPPPLDTIHIKGFRYGQIAHIKKIFREAGVHDGEARDFDFIGNDILEVIVLKPAAEQIISKLNNLCQKFPDRFKHLNVHQIKFDCLDQSNIRRNDIVATPKELLKKGLRAKLRAWRKE